MTKISRFSIFCLAAGLTGVANATVFNFSDALSGANANPPNGSPATGLTFGSYDTSTSMITIKVDATGLAAPVSAAHIHQAPVAGGNGGVIVTFNSSYTGSTSYHMPSSSFSLTSAQETAFLGNLLYVNIHNSVYPGGEIRAFLHPSAAPEPSVFAFRGLGAVAFLVRRRR